MALSKEQLEGLYHKYVQNQCTPEELEALVNELGSETMSEDEAAVTRLFDATWDNPEVFPDKYKLPDLSLPKANDYETPIIKMDPLKRRWVRIAAASIFLLTGAAAYWFLVRTPKTDHVPVDKPFVIKDISPGGNKAVLTLADHSTIVLDSATSGKLAQQGGTAIIKSKDGRLEYRPAGGEGGATISYNMLNTPRGGQYELVLPDGSKVWLNAASSIRYPTAFVGTSRQVDITGEAYFEIAKDAHRPFTVRVGSPAGEKGEVRVLGTQFNVNAYSDEPVVRTTLLEGAVRVTKGAAAATLKPGEQAELGQSGAFRLIPDADVDQTMAWKNGQFILKEADIRTVMRQIERWYDVEVVFDDDIRDKFYVDMSRNTNVSNVFRILESTGLVHFRIDGKKIIVTR